MASKNHFILNSGSKKTLASRSTLEFERILLAVVIVLPMPM